MVFGGFEKSRNRITKYWKCNGFVCFGVNFAKIASEYAKFSRFYKVFRASLSTVAKHCLGNAFPRFAIVPKTLSGILRNVMAF